MPFSILTALSSFLTRKLALRSELAWKPYPMNKLQADNLTRKGAGRPKGSPNKTTALLKDAILMAAEKAGGGKSDGLVKYLKAQATANPGPFLALLGKVLPMQVTGEDGGGLVVEIIKRTYDENTAPG